MNEKVSNREFMVAVERYKEMLANNTDWYLLQDKFRDIILPFFSKTAEIVSECFSARLKNDGVARLLDHLFGIYDSPTALQEEFGLWINSTTIPDNKNKVVESFHNFVLQDLISGKWSLKTSSYEQMNLDMALLSLKPREESVLRERFAIGKDFKTLAKIGSSLGVTHTRVRDIEAKALRKLRHPSRSRRVKHILARSLPERYQEMSEMIMPLVLVNSLLTNMLAEINEGVSYAPVVIRLKGQISKLAESEQELRKRLDKLEPPKLDNSFLSKSVDDLEISVRAYNCLRNGGIHTTAELITKSEGDLLSISGFGKKSLREIKELLAGEGFRLGTDLELLNNH
jgi:hypothetical protein